MVYVAWCGLLLIRGYRCAYILNFPGGRRRDRVEPGLQSAVVLMSMNSCKTPR